MLSMSKAEMLINAFMTSRLDYCNALLGGCCARLINKLQKRLIIKCDSVFLSHIHLLIIFANALTPQPTEQFCLYCVPVWLSGRTLHQLSERLWVRFPGNTCTNKNV